MQTGIEVQDTDRKQGNVMNNNLNHGNKHKENQMNVITKTTSVAVLVTLGLALATVAAEDKPATQPTETKRVVFDRTKLTPEALAGYAAGKPWAKAFDKPKVSLQEASMAAIRYCLTDGPAFKYEFPVAPGHNLQYTFYREHRLPIEGKRDPELAKRFAGIEPTFVAAGAWIASSSALLARETQDPQEKAIALRTARNAMVTVIACANPPDWRYGFYANMVRGLGRNWTGYLSGEKTFEEWLADMHAGSAARYEMMQDCMVCEPGFAFLNVFVKTELIAQKTAELNELAGRLPIYENRKIILDALKAGVITWNLD